MGQIKDDFVNYINNERPMDGRHMNAREIGGYVEDFLIWKTQQIKRNTDIEIAHEIKTDYKPKDNKISMTDEEIKQVLSILNND